MTCKAEHAEMPAGLEGEIYYKPNALKKKTQQKKWHFSRERATKDENSYQLESHCGNRTVLNAIDNGNVYSVCFS